MSTVCVGGGGDEGEAGGRLHRRVAVVGNGGRRT